jgi:feruloyl esterase
MTAEAKAIVAAYYGRAPRRSYWNGCSLGGRQGLSEAQRYPADYDGIVVGDAAYDIPHLYTGRMAVARALHRTRESEIAPRTLALIHAAALDACDGLDGVKDGVIENPQVCHFDPQVLSCQSPGKNEAGSGTCLTPGQVESVRAMYAPISDPRTGAVIFPGLEPGSELGWAALAGAQPENNALDMFKFVVFKDAAWDWRTFDLAPALAAADTSENQVLNAIDPNLRPFFARGGKLLMYHGWADPQTPPQNSIRYHDSVSAIVGRKAAASSMQLFMVPGMGHCEGGDGTDTFDKVAPLDAWVAQGKPPSRIIAAHMTADTFERTRPLCAYPTVARWTGRGSANDAANFTCVAP